MSVENVLALPWTYIFGVWTRQNSKVKTLITFVLIEYSLRRWLLKPFFSSVDNPRKLRKTGNWEKLIPSISSWHTQWTLILISIIDNLIGYTWYSRRALKCLVTIPVFIIPIDEPAKTLTRTHTWHVWSDPHLCRVISAVFHMHDNVFDEFQFPEGHFKIIMFVFVSNKMAEYLRIQLVFTKDISAPKLVRSLAKCVIGYYYAK